MSTSSPTGDNASPMQRFVKSCHFPACLAVTAWAMAYPMTKLALLHYAPVNLAFLRFLFASLILLAIALPRKIRFPKKHDIPLLLAGGVCGFFLYMILFCTGCLTVTSATSAIIIAVSPVITAFLARVVFAERLSWIKWTAIAVEFAGILILTLMNGILSINIGVLYLAAAALLLGAFNLLQRSITTRYRSFDANLYTMVAGTLLLSVFLPGALSELADASRQQLFHLAVLAAIPSASAYALWSWALSRAEKASSVSNYMFVTPFVATLLSFFIAGEVPDAATILGGGVIMAGLAMFTFGDRLSARPLPE